MAYKKKSVKIIKKKVYKKKVPKVSNAVVKYVKQQFSKKLETKRGTYTSTDGLEIGHNSYITLDANVLATTNGTADPLNTSSGNRVGDEINLKGVNFKFMLQLNERYSQCTFRIMVIRGPSGSAFTSDIWASASANKMMDTFNYEKYTLIYSKYVVINAGNNGAITTLAGTTNIGSGLYDASTIQYYSPPSKIVSFNVPGYKFGYGGNIKYQDGQSIVKTYDYKVIVYAYSQFGTSEALGWNVGRVNEYIRQIYFTDA